MVDKKDWQSRGEKVSLNVFNRQDKVFVRGRGSILTDVDGKDYLDFTSGIAVNTFGHSSEELVQAISDQASKLMHTSNLYWNTPSIELAEKLVDLSRLDKVFFANSGAEANEAAIKLARKWGRVTKGEDAIEIISLIDSFHGRTMATITATGQEVFHQDFGPYLAGFKYSPVNDSQALRDLVSDQTAAIIYEPIQGEGGVNDLSDEFIHTLKDLQKDQQVLLIADEIQTGMGRTGEFFTSYGLGLDPDIMTLAKGLGGGFPIGAMLAKDEVANVFQVGDHGTTFGGNPLATKAALTVLEKIERDHILENVRARSQQLAAGLRDLDQKYDFIKEVKGRGLLLGVSLADTFQVNDLIDLAYQKGLLLLSAKHNVLRILPPLNIGQDHIKQGLEILDQVLGELKDKNPTST